MGKYSLENYSAYKTYKVRPRSLSETPDNIGRGRVNYLEYTWEELENRRGVYNITPLIKAVSDTYNPILLIKTVEPSWLQGFEEECFSNLIRRVGSALAKEKHLVGVVITSIGDSRQIWDAYIDAFEGISLLVRLEDDKVIRYLKEREVSFGTIVTCGENNWINCCEAFARYKLQDTWEKNPVILQLTDTTAGPHILKEAARWHAAFSNLTLNIGYDYTLKRLTYPTRVSGEGALPLRFWFVNNGSAPCYQKFSLYIKLKKENKEYELIADIDRKAWKIGDITHNEIIMLPKMEEGTYTLSVGIFFENHIPMHLNIEGSVENGFYKLGFIEVEKTKKDLLLHAWDDFYPDGYYPLEDPKAPN